MYEDRCEFTMMTGYVVPVNDNKEAEEMVRYIERCFNGTDSFRISDTVCRYSKGNAVKYMCVNTVQDMPCVTLLLDAEDAPFPFTEDYGCGYPSAFCYVYNLDAEWCSEFGDCFFKKVGDEYRRVS